MGKQIALDLAKSVYQVAESVRAGQVSQRIGHNKAAVALANKLVRICWAVWCHERRFSGDWQSSKPA